MFWYRKLNSEGAFTLRDILIEGLTNFGIREYEIMPDKICQSTLIPQSKHVVYASDFYTWYMSQYSCYDRAFCWRSTNCLDQGEN